ncbi:uncharacterized protein PHACADRAFT_263669 [Phanerochaete carnosa HHB-10118-sp]|uniref:Uncharacterized protein n=1 Tax=Phanerochaete carnosa (strain HHB-10118-sp) TaxID=650164 RepID=K5WJH7_PHACS|nr:uncharacterized protein PHACADRAFT_263669 [Phanerochaete carnosa HHB-10118-sp]EKM50387.1 hypothetical protein PHACADRAFT_263669 [Phanerochaete carnosa HHB-10118-sp]
MSLQNHEDNIQYAHDYSPKRNSRNSIDLSLELERQLDMESLPTSPSDPRFAVNPNSLDPSVLASLVTTLRLTLDRTEAERDELKAKLSESQNRELGLKDAFDSVSAKCISLEDELNTAVAKNQDDQDAVVMLRGKLEDSRRALMRLQTESRRMTLDLSRAGPSSLITGPPSSRRTSFVPLTGSGSSADKAAAHRRIVSVSEPGSYRRDIPSPPSSARLEPLQLVDGPNSTTPRSSRRISGFFGGTSPIHDLPPTQDASEIVELRKGLQVVKEQLEETRAELAEAREAQEASETCVRALRTFIEENSIGMQPPDARPSAQTAQSAPSVSTAANVAANPAGASRWGFKLWNASAAATTGPPSSSPAASSSEAPSAVGSAPIGRRVTGFFTSRSSISSTSSVPQPHSQQQEPICNGSDSSSVDSSTEPISPSSEVPPSSIMVHNDSRSPSYPPTDFPEHHDKVLSSVDLDYRLESSSLE